MKKIILNIGDIIVSKEPAMLETILGSCVSLCLYDESLKIGGMNHFLVPIIMSGFNNPAYSGKESTKRLIDELIKIGANPSSLKAKIFGGGKVIKGMSEYLDVGTKNVEIAKEMLKKYNITISKELVCLDYAIKVIFYTATGRVFVKKIR